MSEPSAKLRPSNNLPAEDGSPPASSGRLFPKSSRILKSSEFRRVYDQGFRFSTRLYSAFCLDTSTQPRAGGPRLGFTVPRAIGKAVKRNRIKRRMREALRLDLSMIGPQWDIVVNPRRSVLDAEAADVRSEVRKLVNRCKA